MIDFHLAAPRDTEQVVDYLRCPEVFDSAQNDYPNHEEWIKKTQEELLHGNRQALVGTLGKTIVGATVFLVEQDDPTTVAVRNFSIHPDYRGQQIGTQMLGHLEDTVAAVYPEVTRVMVDAKASNPIVIWLTKRGFTILDKTNLYESKELDAVLVKNLQSQDAVTALQPNADHSTH